MLVSLGSVLITLAAPGFPWSDKAANLLPITLNIFRESRAAEWFRARDWASLATLLSTIPIGGVSGLPGTALELVRRLVFFYDNLGVFVAHKVIGRDLAIGFRGVGMNEARPILEPPIRREREIRKIGYAVFYEVLVYQVPFAIARGEISIRKVVVESCRRLVGSSAEARSNVASEHAYQHFMIISSPRGDFGRAVRLESGPVSDPVPYCEGASHRWKSFSRLRRCRCVQA